MNVCRVCGKEISDRSVYCSRKCHGKAMEAHQWPDMHEVQKLILSGWKMKRVSDKFNVPTDQLSRKYYKWLDDQAMEAIRREAREVRNGDYL